MRTLLFKKLFKNKRHLLATKGFFLGVVLLTLTACPLKDQSIVVIDPSGIYIAEQSEDPVKVLTLAKHDGKLKIVSFLRADMAEPMFHLHHKSVGDRHNHGRVTPGSSVERKYPTAQGTEFVMTVDALSAERIQYSLVQRDQLRGEQVQTQALHAGAMRKATSEEVLAVLKAAVQPLILRQQQERQKQNQRQRYWDLPDFVRLEERADCQRHFANSCRDLIYINLLRRYPEK